MTRTVVLIHSPLVGPATWSALAPLLETSGFRVIIPQFRQALHSTPPFYPRIAQTIAEQVGSTSGEINLIAHSGAGALVPGIIHRIRPVQSACFVDALLPHPGKCWFDTASPDLAAYVRSLAKTGRLPRWHEWWPKGSMESMLPDKTAAAEFISELKEVPVEYLEEIAPPDDLPAAVRSTYLQLSAGYTSEADEAERRGWLVGRLELAHLSLITHRPRSLPHSAS